MACSRKQGGGFAANNFLILRRLSIGVTRVDECMTSPAAIVLVVSAMCANSGMLPSPTISWNARV